MHPSLLDAALQVSIGVRRQGKASTLEQRLNRDTNQQNQTEQEQTELQLPFSVQQVQVLRLWRTTCGCKSATPPSQAQQRSPRKLTYTTSKATCAHKRPSSETVKSVLNTASTESTDTTELAPVVFLPHWQATDIAASNSHNAPKYQRHLIISCHGNKALNSEIKQQAGTTSLSRSPNSPMATEAQHLFAQIFAMLQALVSAKDTGQNHDLSNGHGLIQVVLGYENKASNKNAEKSDTLLFDGISAMPRTLSAEHPQYHTQVVLLSASETEANKVFDCAGYPHLPQIDYRSKVPTCKVWWAAKPDLLSQPQQALAVFGNITACV